VDVVRRERSVLVAERCQNSHRQGCDLLGHVVRGVRSKRKELPRVHAIAHDQEGGDPTVLVGPADRHARIVPHPPSYLRGSRTASAAVIRAVVKVIFVPQVGQ
jgi:hypothetical protein